MTFFFKLGAEMTYAPRRLLDLRTYLQDRTGLPAVSLGIIGSQGHHATGTSYHIGWSSLLSGAYSRQHPRDTKLKTDAASATDTGSFNRSGKSLVGLTKWAVAEARAGRRPDTRELIGPWSDGRAYRWAAENGWKAQLRSRGDSHETHLHESWYRDSEGGDKIRYYRGYFEEDDMPLTDADAAKVAKATWRYTNKNVTGRDAYSHLRRSDSEVELAATQKAILAAVTGHDTVEAVREELTRHRAALVEQLATALAPTLAEELREVAGEAPSEQLEAAVERALSRARLVVDEQPA